MVERVCIVRERQSVMVVRDESKDTILRMSKDSVCYGAETEKIGYVKILFIVCKHGEA